MCVLYRSALTACYKKQVKLVVSYPPCIMSHLHWPILPARGLWFGGGVWCILRVATAVCCCYCHRAYSVLCTSSEWRNMFVLSACAVHTTPHTRACMYYFSSRRAWRIIKLQDATLSSSSSSNFINMNSNACERSAGDEQAAGGG